MQVCPVGFFCFNRDTLLITIVAIVMIITYFINKNNSKFDIIKQELDSHKQDLANKINLIDSPSRYIADPIEVKSLERISNPLLFPEKSYPYRVPVGPAAALINVPTRGFSGPIQQVGYLIEEVPHIETYTTSNPSPPPSQPPTQPPVEQPVQPPAEQTVENTVANSIDNAADKIAKKLDTVVEKYINYDSKNSRNMLPLFGGIYSGGGNKWIYYTMHNGIKIPINYNGRECSDSDHGCDEIYNGSSISLPNHLGRYKVSIYKNDAPKYIPYVF